MPTYSNSKLNKFEECPRAYKFQYIQDVEVEEEARSVYLFLGSRVHETLEILHEDLKNGKRNSLEELLEIYWDLWDEEWSEDVQVPGDRYSPEDFRKVGEECITNYYQKHEPFDRDRPIDTELMLYPEVRVDGREYTFVGYIDRLALTQDGKYEVHDYKTSKNLPPEDRLKGKRQLPLYQLGVQQKYPDAEDVELVWHYVRFGKDVRISHPQEEIEEIKREVVDVIEDIERAREEDNFPAMRGEGANCDWCDYKELCPEWEHLYETEDMPENEFLNEDGVKLVDELAEVEERLDQLEERKSELKAKRNKLEKAIIDYADREGVGSVYGPDKRASVEVEEKVSFPKSNEEGREELEELIREFGLWEETSHLNIRTLAKIYREGGCPEELLEKLDDYKRMERSEEVELGDREE